jgi:hypothetical protein
MNQRDKNIERFRRLKAFFPDASDLTVLLVLWKDGDLRATPIGDAIEKNEELPPLFAWAFGRYDVEV